MGNLFLYDLSYNGAWWFITTYCLLIWISPVIVKLVNEGNPWILFFVSGVVYFFSYVCYFKYTVSLGIPIADWCLEQLLLLGRSQFSFVIGAIFFYHHIFDRLKRMTQQNWVRRAVILVVPVFLFLLHARIQSLIIAPITAAGCICCFHVWNKPNCAKRIFAFWGTTPQIFG